METKEQREKRIMLQVLTELMEYHKTECVEFMDEEAGYYSPDNATIHAKKYSALSKAIKLLKN